METAVAVPQGCNEPEEVQKFQGLKKKDCHFLLLEMYLSVIINY